VGQCHVIRGGSFKMPPGEGLRLTWRSNVTDSGASDVGFRVVVRTVVKRPTTSSR
jgi:formylglycine-generating enzyme required for sulfatase activity